MQTHFLSCFLCSVAPKVLTHIRYVTNTLPVLFVMFCGPQSTHTHTLCYKHTACLVYVLWPPKYSHTYAMLQTYCLSCLCSVASKVGYSHTYAMLQTYCLSWLCSVASKVLTHVLFSTDVYVQLRSADGHGLHNQTPLWYQLLGNIYTKRGLLLWVHVAWN
jgi:hypothetical protein